MMDIPELPNPIFEKARRVRLFNWVADRRDLVSFRRIADICAKDPNGVQRHESWREQAYRDLGDAVIRGEFGPMLYSMPYDVPTFSPFWIQRTPVGFANARVEGYDEVRDLWAPRELCARWLRAQGVSVPEMLAPAETEAAGAATATPEPPKRPFCKDEAAYILAGMRRGGTLDQRPTPAGAQAILNQTFDHSPRDPVVRIIRKLWGAGKRGPRNPRNPAPKPHANLALTAANPRNSPRK